MNDEVYLCQNWFHGGDFYPCSASGLISNVLNYLLVLNISSFGIALVLTAGLLWSLVEIGRRLTRALRAVGN